MTNQPLKDSEVEVLDGLGNNDTLVFLDRPADELNKSNA